MPNKVYTPSFQFWELYSKLFCIYWFNLLLTFVCPMFKVPLFIFNSIREVHPGPCHGLNNAPPITYIVKVPVRLPKILYSHKKNLVTKNIAFCLFKIIASNVSNQDLQIFTLLVDFNACSVCFQKYVNLNIYLNNVGLTQCTQAYRQG